VVQHGKFYVWQGQRRSSVLADRESTDQ
jgi:hypothetical protein